MHLFPKEQLPRKKPLVRMRFQDVGQSPFKSESGKEAFYVYWKCWKCGYDAGWCHFEGTVSQVKRGEACPVCNKMEETCQK